MFACLFASQAVENENSYFYGKGLLVHQHRFHRYWFTALTPPLRIGVAKMVSPPLARQHRSAVLPRCAPSPYHRFSRNTLSRAASLRIKILHNRFQSFLAAVCMRFFLLGVIKSHIIIFLIPLQPLRHLLRKFPQGSRSLRKKIGHVRFYRLPLIFFSF